MRRQTVDLLRSPIGGEPLALEIFHCEGADILEGRLVDTKNRTWFRIENGIADLLPLELRALDKYEEFGRRYGGVATTEPPQPHDTGVANSQKKQIAFFGRNYQTYERDVVQSPYYLALDTITVDSWAKRSLRPGSRVLEIGCGSGRQTLLLGRLGVEVLAVDVSDAMVGLAREKLIASGRAATVDLVAASAENLPVGDGLFDACVIHGSLHHFADPPSVLRKVANILKPGGRFYLLEPHNSPVRFIFDWTMRICPLWKEEASDEPLFDETQLRGWLEPNHIQCKIRFSTYLPPHLFYCLGRRVGKWILSGSDRIFSSLPGIRRLAGVIIVEGIKAGLPA